MASFTRTAEAKWDGDLTKGKGHLNTGSGAVDLPYSFNSRFGDEKATNPEELIGAAHAGCFTMALSAALTRAGKPPEHVHTTAKVTIQKDGDGFTISSIELQVEAQVPGVDESEFAKIAADAKANCPVSRALTGVQIQMQAKLLAGSAK